MTVRELMHRLKGYNGDQEVFMLELTTQVISTVENLDEDDNGVYLRGFTKQ